MRESIIKSKAYPFALEIVKLCSELRIIKQYDLANQVFRSGTSICANIEEALAGISKKDFTAKMSIASKEARETNYWLRLIRDSKFQINQIDKLIDNSEEILKMLTSIVKTSQLNSTTTKN